MSCMRPSLGVSDKGEALSTSRYISLILRLLVDSDDQLEAGEFVDLDGSSRGRFVGWDGLTTRLRDLILEIGRPHAGN